MLIKPNKIILLVLSLLLIFEQSGLAQVETQNFASLHLSAHLALFHNTLTTDKYRPLHLRYLGYDSNSNDFKLLLDKGDFLNSFQQSALSFQQKEKTNSSTQEPANTRTHELDNSLTHELNTLMEYFFIGLTLPNESFWVNLRPDSPDNVIDSELAKTDIGKILLEADVQLKKDTALYTSPQTAEGKKYWDKLYKKAEELYGYDNITIPTLTRPWIVPGEIIIRETTDDGRGTPPSAYIYKATLKVMLEEDYLKYNNVGEGLASSRIKNTNKSYEFTDPRSKELNTYSTQLIKELIIPKLTKDINTTKRYSALRQVYYSLILAQWFKQKAQITENRVQRTEKEKNEYINLINSGNLSGLTSKIPWSKNTYYQEYQKSFKDGEYNLKEPVNTPYGQVIRSYFSGGMSFDTNAISSAIQTGMIVQGKTNMDFPDLLVGSSMNRDIILVKAYGGSLKDPGAINLTMEVPLFERAQKGESQIKDDSRFPGNQQILPVESTLEKNLVSSGLKDDNTGRFPLFIRNLVRLIAGMIAGMIIMAFPLYYSINMPVGIFNEAYSCNDGIKIFSQYLKERIIARNKIAIISFSSDFRPAIEEALQLLKAKVPNVYDSMSRDHLVIMQSSKEDEFKEEASKYGGWAPVCVPLVLPFLHMELVRESASWYIVISLESGVIKDKKILAVSIAHEWYHHFDEQHGDFFELSSNMREIGAYIASEQVYYRIGGNVEDSIISWWDECLADNFAKEISSFETEADLQRFFVELRKILNSCSVALEDAEWKKMESRYSWGPILEKKETIIENIKSMFVRKVLLEPILKAVMKSRANKMVSPIFSEKQGEEKIGAKEDKSVDLGGIDGSVSSPSVPEVKKDMGGIDFHAMPIITQSVINPQNNFKMIPNNIASSPLKNVSSRLPDGKAGNGIDDSAEWLQIEKMVNAGIIPSTERIREYLVSSCLRDADFDTQLNKVICCVAAISRMEEERGEPAAPEFKQLLESVESGQTADELRLALTRIIIPEKGSKN